MLIRGTPDLLRGKHASAGGISSSAIHRLPIVIFSGIMSIRTGDCRLQTADQRLAFCWLQPGLRMNRNLKKRRHLAFFHRTCRFVCLLVRSAPF